MGRRVPPTHPRVDENVSHRLRPAHPSTNVAVFKGALHTRGCVGDGWGVCICEDHFPTHGSRRDAV